MKLKTSLFKKGLIFSDIKRYWWVSVLYALILFFTVPFYHYIQKFNNIDNIKFSKWMQETITKDLSFENGVNHVFLLFVPVIIGALVFRYMQKSRSVSLYHSLPLTRASLYFNSVISSLILFISPLLCTAIIMLLLNGFSYLSAFYSVSLIFTWLLYSLLFGIMFLLMSIFVGMFTGNSLAQLVFVYILNFLPMFLVESIRMNLKEVLFGFYTYSNVDFYNRMPMVMLTNMRLKDLTPGLITIYILASVALLIGGLYAFKIRKPETAGDIITFKPIKPVFVYGVTVCATLLGGAYFLTMGKATFAYALFGYLISSLISYVIVQIITNRTIKVLHTYKGYLGFALILAIMAICIKFDFIGYINKIPNPADVEETYIGYNIEWWQNKDNPDTDDFKYGDYDTTSYKSSENIENTIKLHRLILGNRSESGNSQYIAYKLKNGKRIIRRYFIDTDLYSSALGPIYESDEYKNGRFPILHQDVNKLKYIEISDERSNKLPFIVSDKKSLEEFKQAVMKDISKLNYQELINDYQRVLIINIIDSNDKQIRYQLRPSYTNTIDWLKQKGIYDQIILNPETVTSVTLEAFTRAVDSDVAYSKMQQPKRIEIKDDDVIKEILDISLNFDYQNNSVDCSVTFNQKQNSYMMQLGLDGKVSAKLQSYFDKIK